MNQFVRDRGRENTFSSFYESVYPDLVRFVQRRAHPDHAEDVVAEAFMVVWRRLDELPKGRSDARAWVFGITRNLVLNNERGEQRRAALGVRLAQTIRPPNHGPGVDPDTDLVVSQVDLAAAWVRLSEVHQEALGLVVYEGLQAPQAAIVLNISAVAFRLRLSRARRALRLQLDHLPHPSGLPAGVPERTTTT